MSVHNDVRSADGGIWAGAKLVLAEAHVRSMPSPPGTQLLTNKNTLLPGEPSRIAEHL